MVLDLNKVQSVKNIQIKNKFNMKYLPAFVLSFFLSAFPLWSQAASGPYFQGTFEQACRQAQAGQQKLLVKFGASWCMPCVWMDKNVFHHPDAATLLASGVVVVSIDLESPDGKNLRDRFSIRMLPTLLLLDPQAEQVLSRKDEALNLEEFTDWLGPLLAPQAASGQVDQMVASGEAKAETTAPTKEDEATTVSLQTGSSPAAEMPVQDQEEQFFRERDTAPASGASAEKNIPSRELENMASQQDKPALLLGSFYLKTGRYDDLDAAMAQVDRLDELFNQQAALIEDFDKNGELYFSISLGSFATVEEAELFLQLLKRHGITAEIARLQI